MRAPTAPTNLPYLVGTVALVLAAGGALVACGSAGPDMLLGGSHAAQSSEGPAQNDLLGDDSDSGAPVLAAQDAAPPETKGEQLFRAMQATLVTTCGGTGGACHVSGAFLNGTTPVWLGQPDPYLSAKAYPGIITSDPYASKLVIKGPHEGPGFTGPNAAIGTQVLAWLTEEAVEIVAVQLPSTTAFVVQPGPNVVDLSPGAAGISGAKISFVASVDSEDGILSLTNLSVQAPAGSGLHIAHPIFAVVPPTGPIAPDPVDSLSNVDQMVAPAESIPLGTGTLILESFNTGSELKIEFNTLAPVAVVVNDGGGVGAGGCKNVAGFTANAVPAIQANQCLNCHGSPTGSGYGSLDLTKVGIDDTAACAQALTRVNLTNKSQSDIILAPTGGVANHPFQNASSTYATMMLTWINGE
jgi:hypothetical protein